MRAVVAAAFALALAGCSTVDRSDRDEELDAKSAQLRERAADFRVYLAPAQVTCPADAFKESATDRYGMAVDGPRLDAALARAVGGLFRDVKQHDANVGGDPAEVAFRERFDLLLVPRVVKWDAVYVKTNGWWWPNALFVAWYLYFPIWWIGDEVYGVEAQVEFDVVSVRNDRPIRELSGRVTVDSRQVDRQPNGDEVPRGPRVDMDDLDRGIDILGTYTPGDLDRDQWSKHVQPILEPYARRAAALAVADELATRVARFRGLDPGAQAAATAAVHAVVVGVGQYGPSDECPFADKDAAVFASWLTGIPAPEDAAPLRTTSTAAHVPAKLVTTLVNARAGRAEIEEALVGAARDARPEDVIVFYFAGRGARGTGAGLAGLGLACYQATRSDAVPSPNALALSRVHEILTGSKARRRLVVIDASFAGGLRGTDATARSNDALNERRLGELLAPLAGSEGAVVLAARPDAPAHVYEAARHGLFTFALVDGVHGAADVDNQGVTWEALDKHVARCVTTVSELDLGTAQHPVVIAPARRSRVLD